MLVINFNLFTKRAVLHSDVKFFLFCDFVFNVLARRAKIRSPAPALCVLKLQVHYCSDSSRGSFRGGAARPQACGSTGQRLSLETPARPVSPHGHWRLHHPDPLLQGTHTRSRPQVHEALPNHPPADRKRSLCGQTPSSIVRVTWSWLVHISSLTGNRKVQVWGKTSYRAERVTYQDLARGRGGSSAGSEEVSGLHKGAPSPKALLNPHNYFKNSK